MSDTEYEARVITLPVERTITAEGDDAEQAAAALKRLVESDFEDTP